MGSEPLSRHGSPEPIVAHVFVTEEDRIFISPGVHLLASEAVQNMIRRNVGDIQKPWPATTDALDDRVRITDHEDELRITEMRLQHVHPYDIRR